MLHTYKLVCGLRAPLVSRIFTRNKGTVTDPVQQLFLDKLREYKAKSPNDEIVDPTPSVLKELKKELEKLDKNYGGGAGVDMTAFPAFKFEEPKLDSIDEAIPEEPTKKKRTGKKKKTGKKDVPKK